MVVFLDGIINVLKPPGMTSHDVVSLIRKLAGIKKVGHTGTLDPNASGVLPICIGKATKISQYLLDSTKSYRAELTLGTETDTQDIYGTVIRENPVDLLEEEIRKCMIGFVGEYEQIPPMFSALKVKGKKLYDLAREGIEVDRKARKVIIHKIDILSINKNKIIFDVICSKGTYIRTLCKDIGDRLGCGGVMSFLLRTETSSFRLIEAVTIEELKEAKNLHEYLYPIDFPLKNMPKVIVSPSARKAALNGNKISIHNLKAEKTLSIGTMVRVYLGSDFIGIATVKIDDRIGQHIRFSRLFV